MEKIRRGQTQRAACQRCHYRKVKCNATVGQPCAGCQYAKVECIANKRRRRNRQLSSGSYSMTRPSLLPAQPIDQRQSEEGIAIRAVQQEVRHSSPVGTHALPAGLIVDTDDGLGVVSPVVSDGGDDDGSDEVDQAAAALSSMHDAGVQRNLVEMLSQEDIDQRVIKKGVRIVYVGQEFSNINYLIRHRARNEAVHHFPANQIPRQLTSQHLDRIPKEAFYLPPPPVVDDLLENYFKYVNHGFPIIDQEVFMRQYRSRDPQDPPSLLVLQAVLLVGAHVSRGHPDRDELKSGFYRRAKMLFDARFEWNRDVVVQAALLLTWYSEGIDDVGSNSYHWVSVAVRTAFGLGMHRDSRLSTLVPQDRRIWRRLWWILVQFDVLVTLSYGRPQAINLDDADVPPLTLEDFEGLDENVDIEFVIHYAQLCAIISEVVRERFAIRASLAAKTAALKRADTRLTVWMTNLPRSLRPESPYQSLSMWPALLHINFNNFLILLHRPPPTFVAAHNVQAEDIGICSSAVSALITLFEILWRRNELQHLNVFAVNALFTGLIQLSAEMRIRNPLLSANATGKFDTALEVLRSMSRFWLNAGVIERLFEDSSERLQHELQIGRNTAQPGQDSQRTTIPDSAACVEGNPEFSQWDQTNPGQPEPVVSNEQLDWTNLYWENSGFHYMSPFADFGLYHQM